MTTPSAASSATPSVAAPSRGVDQAPAVAASVPTPSSPTDLKTWKARLDTTPPSEAREEEVLQMLSTWAQVDPRAALEYARNSLPQDRKAQGIANVFTGWAQKDPAAAWNWVLTHESAQGDYLRIILSETGKQQPEVAQQFAAAFIQQHPDQGADLYLAVLDGAIHAGKYDEAKRVLSEAKMPNEEQRNNLINYFAGQWAHYEPEKAASWVMQMPSGPARTQALEVLGQAWSEVNPAQAADFAVKLPPGPERQTALKQAISKWTMDDPSQASKWILQFNAHEDFDQAVASLATSSNVMYQNTSLALSWAATIQNPTLRGQTTTAIVLNWYATNPSAALNYVNTAPELTNEARQELLRMIVPPAPSPSTPAP